jgi:tetratricopeptide (TPR) repeat protein
MTEHGSQPGDGGAARAVAARSRRWAVWALAALVAAAGGAAVFWWQHSSPPPSPPPVNILADQDPEPDELAPRNPGYVGPQSCVRCHSRRVAEFQKTRHFLACRPPPAEEMPPAFAPGKGTYAAREPGLRFEMTRDGDAFLQTSFRATPGGEQRSTARIGLVYGSGGITDEVFLTWRGDRLYELPVVWLHPQERWGASPFDPRGREMTPRCLECHNTWFGHVPGTPNQYRRDHFVAGVTCESCHGPAREHVAFHQAHPGEAAHAVVHPGHLTRDLLMDLCAQCHSNAIKHRGPAFSYRPGEPLDAHFRTVGSRHPEDDHVANQVKYLRQSQCYQKSETLTCTTCHNPHRPRGPSNAGSAACQKCHKPADCAEQPRLPAAVRGDCAGCHMPQRFKIQVSFDTEDDEFVPPVRAYEHRIGVYPRGRDEVLLAWYRTQSDARGREEAARLTGALVAYWLGEAESCRREYRFLAATAALREAVRLDPAPATRDKLRAAVATLAGLDADSARALRAMDERRFPEAAEALEKVLRVKPDWAKAHGKLGTAYANLGKNELAAEHLRAVAKYDPDDPYGENMLGWLAYLQGRPEEAVEHYRRADEVEPFTAEINFRWGLALSRLGRWEEAAGRFRRVLAVDPSHVGGCQGLAQALRQQGQTEEALHFARRAARLTHFENADVLVSLAEAYADAGRFAEADAAATRALDAAPDAKAVLQIRLRLDEIRARAKQPPH